MKKILVIDDERPTLTMFRLFLGVYGFDVLMAENGLEGIEIFEKERPPIVITDIKMPGIDGFEVLRRIKEMSPETDVIVVTGHGDMDLAIQALNLNATDFINKPIQKAALDAALSRAEERLKSARACESDISVRTVDDVGIIDILGNLNSRSEPMLLKAYETLTREGRDRIILHFDRSFSVNGAGIAILIQLLTESKKRNQSVAVCGLPENLRKVFSMVGITRFARIFDSEGDAMESIRQAGSGN